MTRFHQPFFKKEINLDDWVREVIEYHFNPLTASPYWLEKEKALGIDARKQIQSYADLEVFGLFDLQDLRTKSIEQFIPKPALPDKESLHVYETGGTTGDPGRIVVKDYWRLQAEWTRFVCDLHGFPKVANWTWIGPTGPHAVGDLVRDLARLSKGVCFHVDLDSRWAKIMVKEGMTQAMELYMAHVRSQTQSLLKTQDIKVFSTTPKLLEMFCPELSGGKCGIQALLYGGTHVSPDLYKIFREEAFKGIPQNSGYGNTLMGNAMLKPWKPGDGYDVQYYPFYPMFSIQVVDPGDWKRQVQYGERGRVRFTTLSKELFLPNVLERDEGKRIGGCEYFGWDGVANVRPFAEIASQTIEGVY